MNVSRRSLERAKVKEVPDVGGATKNAGLRGLELPIVQRSLRYKTSLSSPSRLSAWRLRGRSSTRLDLGIERGVPPRRIDGLFQLYSLSSAAR